MGLDDVVAGVVCESGDVESDGAAGEGCDRDVKNEAAVGSVVWAGAECCAVDDCVGVMMLLLPIPALLGMRPRPPSLCLASSPIPGPVDTAVAVAVVAASLLHLDGSRAACAVEEAFDAAALGVAVAGVDAAAVVMPEGSSSVSEMMSVAVGAVVVAALAVNGGAAVDVAVVGAVGSDGLSELVADAVAGAAGSDELADVLDVVVVATEDATDAVVAGGAADDAAGVAAGGAAGDAASADDDAAAVASAAAIDTAAAAV